LAPKVREESEEGKIIPAINLTSPGHIGVFSFKGRTPGLLLKALEKQFLKVRKAFPGGTFSRFSVKPPSRF